MKFGTNTQTTKFRLVQAYKFLRKINMHPSCSSCLGTSELDDGTLERLGRQGDNFFLCPTQPPATRQVWSARAARDANSEDGHQDIRPGRNDESGQIT